MVTYYVTTTIDFSMGFSETNPQYHLVSALLVFWGAVSVLTLVLPKKRTWIVVANGLALSSYIGVTNNALVIFGLFSELQV